MFAYGLFRQVIMKECLQFICWLCFTPEGSSLMFQRAAIFSLNILKQVMLCPEYKPSKHDNLSGVGKQKSNISCIQSQCQKALLWIIYLKLSHLIRLNRKSSQRRPKPKTSVFRQFNSHRNLPSNATELFASSAWRPCLVGLGSRTIWWVFLKSSQFDSWICNWAYCFSLRGSWRFLEIQLPSLLRVPFPHPFPRVPGDPRPIPNRSAEAVWRQNINSGPSR